jgi:hypothetical protein
MFSFLKFITTNAFAFLSLCSILDEISPENFEDLAAQFIDVRINSAEILHSIIDLIYTKAVSESEYANMYAQLCKKIENSEKVPEFPPPRRHSKTLVSISTKNEEKRQVKKKCNMNYCLALTTFFLTDISTSFAEEMLSRNFEEPIQSSYHYIQLFFRRTHDGYEALPWMYLQLLFLCSYVCVLHEK